MSEHAIEEYKTLYASYVACATKLKPLLEEILTQSKIKFHFVETRAKTVESLAEKIRRPGKSYKNPILDIPDLIGARVVVYYSDDVTRCRALFRKEFKILEEELAHQPEKLSVDQFGYLSIHCIASLSKTRGRLLEWKAYSNLKFEIQVRTVLQHSWAAVSHALQYKREGDVAPELRRKLHRLAGLFELADEEFLSLRDLAKIKARESARAVSTGKDDIPIDASALRTLVKSWKYLSERLEQLEQLGVNSDVPDGIPDEMDHDYFGEMAEHCERLKIKSVADLKSALQFDASAYFKNIAEDSWSMGKGFVLYLLLIGAFPEKFSAEELARSNGWSPDIAKKVVEGAQKAHATKRPL